MLRGLSLSFAVIASLVGLVFPFLFARHATTQNQLLLLVMIIAVSGAFIYGVGFHAENKWLRLIISPMVTWTVMAAAAAGLALLPP